jgi:hypothetical protein
MHKPLYFFDRSAEHSWIPRLKFTASAAKISAFLNEAWII